MYATCRIYRDATELAALVIAHRGEVEEMMRGIPGFDSYLLIKTVDGMVTITICRDKAAADASNAKAAEWIRDNAKGIAIAAPMILAGDAGILVQNAAALA